MFDTAAMKNHDLTHISLTRGTTGEVTEHRGGTFLH